MQTISAATTETLLPFDKLIEALRKMFESGANAPLRHHHTIPGNNSEEATLLLMPAWSLKEGFGGVKLVNVNPANNAHNLPGINASYLLFDLESGQHLCLMDAAILTAKRTAAASALAASYLARPDSSCLLVVGAGKVGSQMPSAFKHVLPIQKVLVWSRRQSQREALAEKLFNEGWDAQIPENLEAGVKSADVISCATFATEPVIKGEWLQPGQHIDLVGSFTPTMREVDDDAIAKAKVFIDTPAALVESGELVIPMKAGVISKDDITATFYQLCAQKNTAYKTQNQTWRQPQDITLFKGVGHAVEDLAAAILVYKSIGKTI